MTAPLRFPGGSRPERSHGPAAGEPKLRLDASALARAPDGIVDAVPLAAAPAPDVISGTGSGHDGDPRAPRESRDAIDSWLAVLVSLLDLPDDECRGVRDELESHLRERVRDLTLAGESDSDATRHAIAELGDAASLARRFQQAIGPSKRRLIMNVAAISLAGAAIFFSGVAVYSNRTPACPPDQPGTPGADGTAAVAALLANPETDPQAKAAVQYLLEAASQGTFQIEGRLPREGVTLLRHNLIPLSSHGAMHGAMESFFSAGSATEVPSAIFEPEGDETAERLASLDLKFSGTVTWREYFERVAKALELRGVPQWDLFAKANIMPNSDINVGPEATALEVLGRSAPDNPVAARIIGDKIVFAPEAELDRQDQTLAVYDIASLIYRRKATDPKADAAEEIEQLLANLVYPEHWLNNGGERAKVTKFDTKLFIQAPRRFHAKIRWVMEQVANSHAAAAAFPGSAAGAFYALPADAAAPAAAPAPTDAIEGVPAAPATAGDPGTRKVMPGSPSVPGVPSDAAPQPKQPTPSPTKPGSVTVGAAEPTVIYIEGDVPRPGVYAYSSGLTAARALAAAGGHLSPKAKASISRTVAGQAKIIQQLDVERLASGNGDDPTLQPGDRLLVRETAGAR